MKYSLAKRSDIRSLGCPAAGGLSLRLNRIHAGSIFPIRQKSIHLGSGSTLLAVPEGSGWATRYVIPSVYHLLSETNSAVFLIGNGPNFFFKELQEIVHSQLSGSNVLDFSTVETHQTDKLVNYTIAKSKLACVPKFDSKILEAIVRASGDFSRSNLNEVGTYGVGYWSSRISILASCSTKDLPDIFAILEKYESYLRTGISISIRIESFDEIATDEYIDHRLLAAFDNIVLQAPCHRQTAVLLGREFQMDPDLIQSRDKLLATFFMKANKPFQADVGFYFTQPDMTELMAVGASTEFAEAA